MRNRSSLGQLAFRLQGGLAVLLVVAAFVLPAFLMREKSITLDEVAHIPAGYSYLTTGIVKLNPMHPPLIKEICALPLLLMGVKVPIDREALRRADFPITFQWTFGREWLSAVDLDRVLYWTRLPVAFLSAALAALVMVWASELWGRRAGLFALLLYLFDPTIVAHAQLVTTDVGMAFFGTLFLYVFRKYLQKPSALRMLLAGVSLGLALGAKFSAIFLIPMTLVLGFIHVLTEAQPTEAGFSRRLARVLGAISAMAMVAYTVLWVIFFFPADPLFYLRGLRTVNEDRVAAYSYLMMGRLTEHDKVPAYFPAAWLIKTPLACVFLFLSSIAVWMAKRRKTFLEEAFLLVPGWGFLIFTSFLANPFGIRYLIPSFPFLFLFTARIVPALKTIWHRFAVAALLLWYVGEFATIWPDHLSYFNQLVGGADHGPEWLDDSNVDWGQGLIQLREYLQSHGIKDYHLCYFGTYLPERYGIHGKKIDLNEMVPRPPSGIWILSAHCLARLRAEITARREEGLDNWLAHTAPRDIVGHAYYVYEIPP